MEDLFSMGFFHQRFTVVLVVFLLSGVALQWQDFVLHCEGSRPRRPRTLHVERAAENVVTPAAADEHSKRSSRNLGDESVLQRRSNNYTRRVLGMCGSGNPIDDCWRCDYNWESPRQSLADCVTGFGKNSIGGKNGQIHVVTDDTGYDVINPAPGTLRYGVVKSEPLWIVFARNMMITLQEELVMNSFKAIDGRDHNVHIAGGACHTFQYVSNIIIHGVHIHDCKSTGHAVVRGSPTHLGRRGGSDGDGINVFAAHDVWVDHCYFSNCNDSLIDAIHGSTAITTSNNYFTNHDK